MLAALVETVLAPVVVAEEVGLREVLNPPVALAPDPPPDTAVVVCVAFEPDPPMPLGERPEPELAMTPPVAAVDAEDAALAKEEPVVAVPDDPEPVAEAEAVDAAELLELEETLEQERSNSGVELKGVPEAIPKLGLGEALLSVSSRVYHQVLTTPKLGHPTSSQ